MNVFLTGVTGYIGSVIAEKLLASGYDVTGLVRSEAAAAKLQKLKMDIVIADIRDTAKIARLARDANAVIHVAFSQEPDWAEVDLHTVNAILAALDGSGRSFIIPTSSMVYGNTGAHICREDAPFNPPSFLTGRAVLERTMLHAATRNVRSNIVHAPLVYGRNGGNLLTTLLRSAQQEGVGTYIGNGENRWSTIHVDDWANLCVCVLELAPAGLSFNAAGPAFSLREVATYVSKATGGSGICRSISVEEARQRWGFFGDVLTMNQQFSSKRAVQLLGWKVQSPSLEESLLATIHLTA